MMRTRSSRWDRVIDGAAAAFLHDLDDQVGCLINRHRALAIAEHVRQALPCQARIPVACGEHDVGRISSAAVGLNRF